MLTLLIETSTERGVVFIFEEDRLICEEYLPVGLHNSTDLLPAIQRCLKKLGVLMKNIGLIGVGVGPGSYTGLRVGAMAAKTLSYAGQIPLVGVCTLSCFASKKNEPFAVIIDAKIGGAYVQVDQGEPVVTPLQDLHAYLDDVKILVTPNSKLLAPKLLQLYPENQWKWEELAPSPQSMLNAVKEKYGRKNFSLDGSVSLLYMRKTQAEIEKEHNAKTLKTRG